MTKDNLSSSDLKDRTVYVSVVNVADLPEAVAREISQGRVYSLNSSTGERLALVKDLSLTSANLSPVLLLSEYTLP